MNLGFSRMKYPIKMLSIFVVVLLMYLIDCLNVLKKEIITTLNCL